MLAVFDAMISQSIVPPKPTAHQVMRRRKSWRCGLTTVALALFAILLMAVQMVAESLFVTRCFVGCVVLTCLSGILSLIFRFTERPTEVTIRRWPEEPALIH